MFVLLSVYTFSTVTLTCTVGRFYYLCAWTLILLISYALALIYTFPQLSLWLFTNVVLFVPVLLFSFTLIENKVHYLNVFFKRVIFCTKLKNLGFVRLSVSFTTPKCDFSKVLSWYMLNRRGKWNGISAELVLNKFENVTFIFLPSCLC